MRPAQYNKSYPFVFNGESAGYWADLKNAAKVRVASLSKARNLLVLHKDHISS